MAPEREASGAGAGGDESGGGGGWSGCWGGGGGGGGRGGSRPDGCSVVVVPAAGWTAEATRVEVGCWCWGMVALALVRRAASAAAAGIRATVGVAGAGPSGRASVGAGDARGAADGPVVVTKLLDRLLTGATGAGSGGCGNVGKIMVEAGAAGRDAGEVVLGTASGSGCEAWRRDGAWGGGEMAS